MTEQLALFFDMPAPPQPIPAPARAVPGQVKLYAPCRRCGSGPVFRWIGSPATWSVTCSGCGEASCGGRPSMEHCEAIWERWNGAAE